MTGTMLKRYETRGGKYSLELWAHPNGRFDIYEFERHLGQRGASVNFTEEGASIRLSLYISDAKSDGINYRQTYPKVQS